MAISNYENGFPNGLTIRGIPLIDIQNSAGQVFWVDSSYYSAGDANKGTFTSPLKTLSAAIVKCRPNQGDKIFVAAGHYEEIDSSNSISVDVPGVQIIGLGTKNNRPLFKFITNGASSFDIDAANIYVGNIRFVSNVPAAENQPRMVGIWAKYSYFENVVFEGTSNTHGAITHLSVPAVSDVAENNNIADFSTFKDCEFYTNTTSIFAEQAIHIGSANKGLKLLNCIVDGQFNTAAVYNPDISPAFFEDFEISGSYHNEVFGVVARALSFESDKNGIISRDTVMLTESISYPVYASKGRSGRNISGDLQYVVNDIAATSIDLTGFDLTGAINGYFSIESISLETSGAAITTATTIEIAKINEFLPHGNPVFLSVPIASLGADQTVDMQNSAITISNRGTIGLDGKIVVRATGTPAAGGGIRVKIGLRAIIDSSGLGRII